jgi:hypothetical protein
MPLWEGNPNQERCLLGEERCVHVHSEWQVRDRLYGVPVAGVQKTTIRTFTVNEGEENEGLRPHILVAKTPDFAHVYCGISPTNKVFFLTSAVCLVCLT